jgi:hypothetical protein
VEGIPAQDGQHLFVAQSPEEFVEKITEALAKKSGLLKTGYCAREFIRHVFSNLDIADRVISAYRKCPKN